MYLEIDGSIKKCSISPDGKACSEMAGVSAKVFFGVMSLNQTYDDRCFDNRFRIGTKPSQPDDE